MSELVVKQGGAAGTVTHDVCVCVCKRACMRVRECVVALKPAHVLGDVADVAEARISVCVCVCVFKCVH